MDKLCVSSWTGAHEKFQAREYDARASPTSSEPARRQSDNWTSLAANFEFLLGFMCKHKCVNLMKVNLYNVNGP